LERLIKIIEEEKKKLPAKCLAVSPPTVQGSYEKSELEGDVDPSKDVKG